MLGNQWRCLGDVKCFLMIVLSKSLSNLKWPCDPPSSMASGLAPNKGACTQMMSSSAQGRPILVLALEQRCTGSFISGG